MLQFRLKFCCLIIEHEGGQIICHGIPHDMFGSFGHAFDLLFLLETTWLIWTFDDSYLFSSPLSHPRNCNNNNNICIHYIPRHPFKHTSFYQYLFLITSPQDVCNSTKYFLVTKAKFYFWSLTFLNLLFWPLNFHNCTFDS
jgi:hypothetical protein